MTEYPRQSQPTSWGSLLAGLAVGALVGAVASLLNAPKSGKETREDLLQRLDALKEQVEQTAAQVAEATRIRFEETQADLAKAFEAGRAAAAEQAAQVKQQAGME